MHRGIRILLIALCLACVLTCAFAENGFITITTSEDEEAPAATSAPPAVLTTPEPTAEPAATPAVERWCDSQPFAIRHGSRDVKRVAITMDDCYDRGIIREIFDFCQDAGVPMTFFPLGDQLKKKDAELWRAIAASGCEIGSHTNHHSNLPDMSYGGICIHIYRTQEILDEVLGYHYGMVSLRPPFGHYTDDEGHTIPRIKKACEKFGYNHVVLWDVSQTHAEQTKKDVKNGSILLFHARKKDMNCIKEMIPWLLEEGYELVTVRELLDFPEIEIGPEPYVYPRDAKRSLPPC
ncbi:MAG: polysaccharide deacetylase family protein [Clostridia bacterium]|nr:polysaccharide deacetylase family protein [Clostridia bacterium]